ncbi:MAG: asparaginase domain-containing protein, partial [Clostridia bacterium]
MKNVLIINLGGTIGSEINNDNSISLSSNEIIKKAFEDNSSDINFEFKTPFEIHSENLNNSHLNVLYNLFKTINYSDYIGIIITHGSDTLPYTSAFLSLICQDTPIPIIITASNRPISHPKSNAIVNLKSSLWFILNANTN